MLPDNINEKKENHSLIGYDSNSKSNDDNINNIDLLIDNIPNIIGSEGNSNLQTHETVSNSNLSIISNQEAELSTDTFESTFDNINYIVVNKLIAIIIKKHNYKSIFTATTVAPLVVCGNFLN